MQEGSASRLHHQAQAGPDFEIDDSDSSKFPTCHSGEFLGKGYRLDNLYNICSVRRFATEVVGPKVREMDENEMMDPEVIKGLFEQGVSNLIYMYIVLLDI